MDMPPLAFDEPEYRLDAAIPQRFPAMFRMVMWNAEKARHQAHIAELANA